MFGQRSVIRHRVEYVWLWRRKIGFFSQNYSVNPYNSPFPPLITSAVISPEADSEILLAASVRIEAAFVRIE